MSKWFGGIILYKFESGVLKVLIQDSESTNPAYKDRGIQTKFPGGTDKGHPEDKDTWMTARRELEEETFLRVADDPQGGRHVLYVQAGPVHYKDFFSIPFEACSGLMRTEIMYGEDTKLYPPYWVPLSGLAHAKSKLYGDHKMALESFFQKVVTDLKYTGEYPV